MAKTMDRDKLMVRGTNEGFTPYMIAKLVNWDLEDLGLEEIRPQMMYNYDRNGIINGTKRQNETRPYTLEETEKFVPKFVEMRATKARAKKAPEVPSSFTIEDVENAKSDEELIEA